MSIMSIRGGSSVEGAFVCRTANEGNVINSVEQLRKMYVLVRNVKTVREIGCH